MFCRGFTFTFFQTFTYYQQVANCARPSATGLGRTSAGLQFLCVRQQCGRRRTRTKRFLLFFDVEMSLPSPLETLFQTPKTRGTRRVAFDASETKIPDQMLIPNPKIEFGISRCRSIGTRCSFIVFESSRELFAGLAPELLDRGLSVAEMFSSICSCISKMPANSSAKPRQFSLVLLQASYQRRTGTEFAFRPLLGKSLATKYHLANNF